jgi:hypothetical protein
MVTGTGTPIDPPIDTVSLIGPGMLTRATMVRDSLATVGWGGVDGVGGVGGDVGSQGRAFAKLKLTHPVDWACSGGIDPVAAGFFRSRGD